ncbi:MAG: IS1634 family transposase [Candidatus Pacebacteria bacterium]|nr:IS1634 family transposase [Candidatus Paceibacterota bacterium]
MGSTIRTKIINGQEYLYEITYYYDPASKRTRQRSRYLGKSVDGEPVRVRDANRVPRLTFAYGEYLPLLAILDALRLDTLLSEHLPGTKVQALLTLALNRVISPLPLSQIESWWEGTVLAHLYPDLSLSSNALSTLLETIGSSDLPLHFCRTLVRSRGNGSALLYDITSISSWTNTIPLFERGYNRDGLDLRQINLSLTVDRTRGIPLWYEVYPGSIVDVSTLGRTITTLTESGVQDTALVMDRGFFSVANLDALLTSPYEFVLPPTTTMKTVKQAYAALHTTVDHPDNLHLYEGKTLFVQETELVIGDQSISAFAYFSPSREQQERESFYRQLHERMERLREVKLRPWMNPAEVVESIARSYEKYIAWTLEDGRFVVKTRPKAVAARVNRMGMMILLYRGDFTWESCLALYREKDLVEKSFNVLKNEIEVMPLRQKSEETVRGVLFVAFLALVVRMAFRKRVQDAGLQSRYPPDRLLLELSKLRMVEMANGSLMITEVTKKQREILKALGIDPQEVVARLDGWRRTAA